MFTERHLMTRYRVAGIGRYVTPMFFTAPRSLLSCSWVTANGLKLQRNIAVVYA